MKLIGYQIYSFGDKESERQHDWMSFGGIMTDRGEAKALLSIVQHTHEGLLWQWKLVGIVELDQS